MIVLIVKFERLELVINEEALNNRYALEATSVADYVVFSASALWFFPEGLRKESFLN